MVKSAPLRLASATITCYMNFRNYFDLFGPDADDLIDIRVVVWWRAVPHGERAIKRNERHRCGLQKSDYSNRSPVGDDAHQHSKTFIGLKLATCCFGLLCRFGGCGAKIVTRDLTMIGRTSCDVLSVTCLTLA